MAVAKGASYTEAYTKAGFKPSEPHASRLASRGIVEARIEELRTKIAEATIKRIALTRADVLGELAKIAMVPIRDNEVRPTDKRAALMNYSQVEGWVIERVETAGAGEFKRIAEMSADELRAYIAGTDRAGKTEVPGLRQNPGANGGGAGSAGSKPH
jgi:hypothetical protein